MTDSLFHDAVVVERLDDQPNELRGILCYHASSGKLYIATDSGELRCAEVRQQLLSGEWADPNANVDLAVQRSTSQMYTWQPLGDVDITPTALSINRSGTYAFLAGPTLEDPEIFATFVIDLALAPRGSSGVDRIPLDASLFSSRPGLCVLQASWHPESDRHVAVLTSDATWRLYDALHPDLAEQTFELMAQGGRRGLTVVDTERNAMLAQPVTFCFGQGAGWERFAVYFLLASGSIVTLCPVAPFGARYLARNLQALHSSLQNSSDSTPLSEEDADNTAAWLSRAFTPLTSLAAVEDPEVLEVEACQPHALDEHSPLLSPPLSVLRVDEESTSSGTGWQFPGNAEALAMWCFGGACTAVAIASARGPIALHILSRSAMPRWHAIPPQCLIVEGDLVAVRSQCGAAHLISKQRAHGGQEAASQQQLLLMDVIGLPAAISEEELAEDEVDTGEGSGATPGSRRVMIDLDQAFKEVVYCLHPQKAYVISLPWLPIVAEHLATLTAAASETLGSFQPTKALPDVLPTARAEEMYRGPPNATAAAAVGDPLCGSGLVVLKGDSTGYCLRPPQHILGPIGVSAEMTSKATAHGKPGLEAYVQKMYGDALKGASAKQLPSSQEASAVGSDSPAGQRVLAEAIAALQAGHVEYAHRAHHDLTERLCSVLAEVTQHAQRAERLLTLIKTAEENSDRLNKGMERAQWLSVNLARRLQLLAELHWAAPRRSSAAELAFRRDELPDIEAMARQLAAAVQTVSARVGALQSGDVGLAGAAASSAAPLSLQQLRRMRELLAEHDCAIRAAMNEADALKRALSVVISE